MVGMLPSVSRSHPQVETAGFLIRAEQYLNKICDIFRLGEFQLSEESLECDNFSLRHLVPPLERVTKDSRTLSAA